MSNPEQKPLCDAHSGLAATMKAVKEKLDGMADDLATAAKNHRDDMNRLWSKLDNDVMHAFNAALKRWPTSVVVAVSTLVGLIGVLGGLLIALRRGG